MKLDLNSVAVDPAKMSTGAWWRIWRDDTTGHIDGLPCAADADEPRILVVPAGVVFDRIRDEERRAVIDRLRDRSLTDEEVRILNGKILGRAVFRGAANIEINGEPFVWTEEAAIKLINNPQMAPLRMFLERISSTLLAVAVEEEAKAAGN